VQPVEERFDRLDGLSNRPSTLHLIYAFSALDILATFALYIYEKFGQGFASRGWSVDVVNCLEKIAGRRLSYEFYTFN
jgi:hypothetical protein